MLTRAGNETATLTRAGNEAAMFTRMGMRLCCIADNSNTYNGNLEAVLISERALNLLLVRSLHSSPPIHSGMARRQLLHKQRVLFHHRMTTLISHYRM